MSDARETACSRPVAFRHRGSMSHTKSAASDSPVSLLVASTGGHLMQLTRLVPRLELRGRPVWVTFDSPQSRSLLDGQDVEFVRYTGPRDGRNVIRNLPDAYRLLRRLDVAEVISTGSAVALSFVPLARAQGIPCSYIESAARSVGPSLTGQTLARLPGVRTFTQYERWADDRWKMLGSVLDEFVPQTTAEIPTELKVVVALGTLPFRFDRLVEAVKRSVVPTWSITWQTGPMDYGQLPGTVHSVLSASEFAEMCRDADLVISHSGVGTALAALEAGKHPVLVPRAASHDEHIDDHQVLVGTELSARGLATLCNPDALTTEMLARAARDGVRRIDDPKPLKFPRSAA